MKGIFQDNVWLCFYLSLHEYIDLGFFYKIFTLMDKLLFALKIFNSGWNLKYQRSIMLGICYTLGILGVVIRPFICYCEGRFIYNYS